MNILKTVILQIYLLIYYFSWSWGSTQDHACTQTKHSTAEHTLNLHMFIWVNSVMCEFYPKQSFHIKKIQEPEWTGEASVSALSIKKLGQLL